MLKHRYSTAYAVTLSLLICSPTWAQTADPATIEIKADETPAAPPEQTADKPTVVEKVRGYVEKSPLAQRGSSDGFYPRLGGLSTGSGLAGGGGYRRHFGSLYAELSGAVSTKVYLGVDAKVRWLQTSEEGFEIWTDFKYRDNTQDDFYALGLDSTTDSRVDYGLRSNDIVVRSLGHVGPWFRVGTDVGYYTPDLRHGRNGQLPSIEQVYTDATAPGLDRQANFLHSSVFTEIDSRDVRGFPHRGGLYRVTYAFWNDRSFEEYDFRRFDIQGSQFVGLTSKDVVAVQLTLSYANNARGDRIPFFMLPYAGGGHSMRAFHEFRFRDENAGVFNAEFRHRVHKWAHVAGFVDMGKVAHDWQDINLKNLKTGYGFGVRAGNDNRSFGRLDVGFGGGEGVRVFLKFSPSF